MLQQTRPQQKNHSAKPGRCASFPAFPHSRIVRTSPVQRSAGTRYAYKVRGAVLLQAVGIGECQIPNRSAGKPADRIAWGRGQAGSPALRAQSVRLSTPTRIYPAWHGLGTVRTVQEWGSGRAYRQDVARKPLITWYCGTTAYRAAATRTTQRQAERDRAQANRRTLPVGCQRRDGTPLPQARSRTREAA